MTYKRKFQECPWRTLDGKCTNKTIPAHECKIKLKNCKTYNEWDKLEKPHSELPKVVLDDIYKGCEE